MTRGLIITAKLSNQVLVQVLYAINSLNPHENATM